MPRKKKLFKKGQKVFVLAEDGIEEHTLHSSYDEDDTAVVIQPDDDDSFWVEAWQVAPTREQLVRQIHQYAEYKIADLHRQIAALAAWKKKYK